MLEWPKVGHLRRLGGGEERPDPLKGKQVQTRGLRRLLDLQAIAAILAAGVLRHGSCRPASSPSSEAPAPPE